MSKTVSFLHLPSLKGGCHGSTRYISISKVEADYLTSVPQHPPCSPLRGASRVTTCCKLKGKPKRKTQRMLLLPSQDGVASSTTALRRLDHAGVTVPSQLRPVSAMRHRCGAAGAVCGIVGRPLSGRPAAAPLLRPLCWALVRTQLTGCANTNPSDGSPRCLKMWVRVSSPTLSASILLLPRPALGRKAFRSVFCPAAFLLEQSARKRQTASQWGGTWKALSSHCIPRPCLTNGLIVLARWRTLAFG